MNVFQPSQTAFARSCFRGPSLLVLALILSAPAAARQPPHRPAVSGKLTIRSVTSPYRVTVGPEAIYGNTMAYAVIPHYTRPASRIALASLRPWNNRLVTYGRGNQIGLSDHWLVWLNILQLPNGRAKWSIHALNRATGKQFTVDSNHSGLVLLANDAAVRRQGGLNLHRMSPMSVTHIRIWPGLTCRLLDATRSPTPRPPVLRDVRCNLVQHTCLASRWPLLGQGIRQQHHARGGAYLKSPATHAQQPLRRARNERKVCRLVARRFRRTRDRPSRVDEHADEEDRNRQYDMRAEGHRALSPQ
jgi:hypothetical protein